jgi:hypothetical protein
MFWNHNQKDQTMTLMYPMFGPNSTQVVIHYSGGDAALSK